MKKALKTAARGTVFPYAGEKWVVLEHDPAGRTLCLRLEVIPDKPFDEDNRNNFAISSSKEWMNGPYGWTDAADIKTSSSSTATSYLVKVTTDVLNIRKGPGTNYGTNGAIRDKGTYTIVAESDGPGASKWGKLKSGAGWISLDYTKKV